jgi:hypothetical protein
LEDCFGAISLWRLAKRFATLRPIQLPPTRAGKRFYCAAEPQEMELAMIGKWAFRITALFLVLSIGEGFSRGEAPWSSLLSTNRVDADPAKEYVLKESQGPWIIIACSFNGVNARREAHDLVLELRKRYRLEAFVYEYKFKLDDPNASVQPLYASPRAHVYQIVAENPKAYGDGQIKEIAVVVGNFAGVDDPEARQTLQKLKSADPECLRKKNDDLSLGGWRALQASVTGLPKFIEGRRQTGPMAHAFITCNPLLPEDYFSTKGGVDELVLRMNKDVKHSLLNCPGKYTVQVAHFTGEVIINQNEIRAIESGAKAGPESTQQGLAAAAEKAHDLTEALRMKGFEAYEFHDINASLVTVGNFDSVGTPRADGKIEINPRVHQIIEFFRAQPAKVAGAMGAMEPRSFIGIYFDTQPIPVLVPKKSISNQLSHRLETAGE